MRNIFTYPDNAGTYYIDPNLVGGDTTGFQRRVQDMIDGNIGYWNGTPPINDKFSLMENFSRFINYYEDFESSRWPNVGFNFFNYWPMIVADLEPSAAELTNRQPVLLPTTGANSRFTTASLHRFQVGDTVGFRDTDFRASSYDERVVAVVNNEYQFEIANAYSFNMRTGFMVREDAGTRVYLADYQKTDPGYIWMTGELIDNQTGTANQRGVNFYAEPFDTATSYDGLPMAKEYLLYTDPAKTIPAVLSEGAYGAGAYETVYYQNFYIPAGGGFDTFALTDLDSTALFAFAPDLAARIDTWDNTYLGPLPVRLQAINASNPSNPISNYSSPVLGTQPIGLGLDYGQLFWLSRGSVPDTYSIWCDRDMTSAADFQMGHASQSTDVNIIISVIADQSNLWIPNLDTECIGRVHKPDDWNTSLNQTYYRISDVTTWIPGNVDYLKRIENGDYTAEAQLDDRYYTPGNSSYSWSNPTKTPVVPQFTFDFKPNKRLISVDVDPLNRGKFRDNTPVLLSISPVPWTYVNPAETPEEIAGREDNFDTENEWDTTGYNANKYWPTHIPPVSADISIRQPSVTNFSQGGDKYVRSSGYSKWTMDVEYPPMSADDFRIFQATALKARGQAIPFLFKLYYNDRGNNTNILWGKFTADASTNEPYVVGYNTINRTITLGGFASNESTVFQAGEIIIGPSLRKNGDINSVVNTIDANVYGEAKIKLAEGWKYPPGNLGTVYKHPYWIVVTLANDDFNYTVDINGLYRVKVKFELDDYK